MRRIFLAEGFAMTRYGLAAALRERDGFEVVGKSAQGADALAGILDLTPDVAVIGGGLGAVDGLSVLAGMARCECPTRAVMIAAQSDSEAVYRAVAAGAIGFLGSDAGPHELRDAVARAARGEGLLSPAVYGQLRREIRRHSSTPGFPQLSSTSSELTAREREVLEQKAYGLGAAEIAERLFLEVSTVRTHLRNAYPKLGVRTAGAAVAKAVELGLIEGPSTPDHRVPVAT